MAFGPSYFQILKRGRNGVRAGDFALGGLIVIGLALLCIVLAANLFWALARPVGSIGNWRTRAPLTIPASGRIALYSAFDPFSRSSGAIGGDVAVTSLSLTLFGTRVNEFSGNGSAILASADGIQQSYAVGEEVMPGVILSSVAFDHVVLTRGVVKESLFIDQSIPAENVGGETPTAAAPQPAAPASGQDGEVRLNAATLRDSVSVAPRNEAGRITGLVLTAKDDGSMMRNAGLASGDIIVSINGRPVGSPADIAAQLRPGAKLTLEVERGAQKIPVGLNLE